MASTITSVRKRHISIGLIGALGLVTAVPPFSVDTYVPGFPGMRDDLHTSELGVQLTLTGFLLGFSIGQFVIGPLSDKIGRRGLMISGAVGFSVFALVCALAPNLSTLVAARFFQGVFGAAGTVLARTVIHDVAPPHLLPKYFGMLTGILSVAPVVAPLAGGVILEGTNWRGVFAFMSILGVIMFTCLFFFVPETLEPEARRAKSVGGIVRSMRDLLCNRIFLRSFVVAAMCSAIVLSYLGSSRFVMETTFGVSDLEYSLGFASSACGMVLATVAFITLSRRVGIERLLVAGLTLSGSGCSLLVVMQLVAPPDNPAWVWLGFSMMMSGMGLVQPAALSAGQLAGGSSAGAASALLGGTQFIFGAVAAPIASLVGTSVIAVSTVCLTLVTITATSFVALRPRP